MRWADSKYKWVLLLILLLALGLRLWNINFRLPYVYHPDEPWTVGKAVNAFNGNLNPHFYEWGSLTFYVHATAYVPYYLVGKMAGVFKTRADLPSPDWLVLGSFMAPSPSLWIYSRVVNVLFGVGSVLLVFLVGRVLVSNLAGLIAALLLTFSHTSVVHSHYIAPDTPLVFFVLLSFLGTALVFQEGKLWHYVLAGAASGFAAAVKYPAGLVIFSMILAHFLRYGKRGLTEKKVYIGILCSALGFFVTMPYAVLDFTSFLHSGILHDVTHYTGGHAGAEGQTLQFYFRQLHVVEGPAYIFAVLGLMVGLIKYRKQTVLLASFGFMYFVLISSLKVRFDRTLLPVLPFVFLLAALFIGFFLPKMELFKGRVLKWLVVGIVIICMVVMPLPGTIKEIKNLVKSDSRDTARVWINENLQAKSKIVIEAYAPFIDAKKFSVTKVGTLSIHPPEWYAEFDYLIFSQGIFKRYVDHRDQYSDVAEKYDALWESMELVKEFNDGGYKVLIYGVPKSQKSAKA
jgi:4-amino-4-deoxy-L-arabinose transferase-like glycosyltransferase